MSKICILDDLHEEDEPALIELFTSAIGREFLGGPAFPHLNLYGQYVVAKIRRFLGMFL